MSWQRRFSHHNSCTAKVCNHCDHCAYGPPNLGNLYTVSCIICRYWTSCYSLQFSSLCDHLESFSLHWWLEQSFWADLVFFLLGPNLLKVWWWSKKWQHYNNHWEKISHYEIGMMVSGICKNPYILVSNILKMYIF